MRKRILLIIESLGSGGAERQICGLAALLTQKGYICRLITYVDNQFYEPYLKEHNVDYEYVPELLNKRTRVFKLAKYMRRYSPDTIISFLPSVNMSVCLAHILYPHCQLIVSERNNNTSISKKDRFQFNLYRIADYIVPNSYSQGEFIKKNFSFLSKKVKTIVNFVDLEKFIPSNIKIPNPVTRIITVARYTKQKNCLLFLDAVKKVKESKLEVHFDWYGSKNLEPLYFDSLVKRCEDLCIDDYITLHDSTRDIAVEYQKSDAFCLPSLYEGYPNVIVEAMACGLPIICSNVYDNPQIVTDGINGFLFDPRNVDEMVEAVCKIISLTKSERIMMVEQNRNKCVVNNTQEAFVIAYIELIEK